MKIERQERRNRHVDMIVIAFIIILFGMAEVATGVSHNFFGVTISAANIATYLGVSLGFFYFAGGCLLLINKKWAAGIAIALLCGDVLGRVAMVVTGLYPLDTLKQGVAIILGTLIAALFAIFIGLKFKQFQKNASRRASARLKWSASGVVESGSLDHMAGTAVINIQYRMIHLEKLN